MDLAHDVFITVFIIVIIALVIYYVYHLSRGQAHVIGPIVDGDYAIHHTSTATDDAKGFLTLNGDKLGSSLSTPASDSADSHVTSHNSIWRFENNLDSQGDNYYISQIDQSGNPAYLTIGPDGVITTNSKTDATVWRISKAGANHFIITSTTTDTGICLSMIRGGLSLSNYGGKSGDPALCNYSGSLASFLKDGSRAIELYAAA